MELIKEVILPTIAIAGIVWNVYNICNFFYEVPRQLKRIADTLEKKRVNR